MLQTASAETKKTTARGSAKRQPARDGLLAPPVLSPGNQATLRLIRKCDCGAPDCDCDMGEHRKKEDSPRTGLHRKPSGPLPASPLLDASTLLDAEAQAYFEARLQQKEPPPSVAPFQTSRSIYIGATDDPLEQEADRIADRVVRMPDPRVSISSATLPIGLKRVSREEEKTTLQQKGDGQSRIINEAPNAVHEVLNGPGRPLDAGARAFFEPRFGRDLSEVRIHADFQAASTASSINALAYTVGRDIAFADSQYQTGTPAGLKLLAHELAHVIQQNPKSMGARRQDHAAWEPISQDLTQLSLPKLQREPAPAPLNWTPGINKEVLKPITDTHPAVSIAPEARASGTGRPSGWRLAPSRLEKSLPRRRETKLFPVTGNYKSKASGLMRTSSRTERGGAAGAGVLRSAGDEGLRDRVGSLRNLSKEERR